MHRFIFIASLFVVILGLTTCKSDACPLLAETRPASLNLTNGGGYPSYGPDGSLFPQPDLRAIEVPERGFSIPVPSATGFGQFVQLLLTAFLTFYLRRQTILMEPPK